MTYEEKLKHFTYDSENHIGYYDDMPIPSITQLVSILYPLDSTIKDSVLEKASEKGTLVHNDIELYNTYGASPKTIEGKNYRALVEKLGLECVSCEQLVLIELDNKVVAYGHYDQVLRAKNNVLVSDKGLVIVPNDITDLDTIIQKDCLIMTDTKTVSDFNDKKVAIQENLYTFGYNQDHKEQIENILGIWVRTTEKENIAQVRPLPLWDNEKQENMLRYLLSLFADKVERNYKAWKTSKDIQLRDTILETLLTK